jgi:hypothetical protein
LAGVKRLARLVGAAVLAVGMMSQAAAQSVSAGFGPAIDDYASYQGQNRCDPDPEPGVLSFRSFVLNRYAFTRAGSISRACHIGGRSEHKEGRAWDWGVRVSVRREKAAAEALIDLLHATDRHGNQHAMARRFGIMYLIWNRRIWGSWGGWSTYCVQRRGACRADDGSVRHPHTDHVHFSFGWAGARRETTYWHKDLSLLGAGAAHPTDGYWAAGRGGRVFTDGGAGWYGDRWGLKGKRKAVDVASSPTGGGYLLVTGRGRVLAFGDAVARGGTANLDAPIARIATKPDGRGYWLVTRRGRVFAFGKASHLGNAHRKITGDRVVDISATPTGLGYWIFTASGRVLSFGDAVDHGEDASLGNVVAAANYGADGYWLATSSGKVVPFGRAPDLGGLSRAPAAPIVDLFTTPTDLGYWLLGQKGRVIPFGDAADYGAVRSSRSQSVAMPRALSDVLTAIRD